MASQCRYQLRYPDFPIQLSANKTQSLLPCPGSPGTTFEFNCGTANASLIKKTLALVPDSIRNLITAYKKKLPHELDIANPFPPDLWDYVYGFGHQPEGSIAPLAYYNLLRLIW